LQQAKEKVNEELRKKMAEVTEMQQEMEEKTKVIAENAKEISGLHIQLNESRLYLPKNLGFSHTKINDK
jgi:hypothetical protein